MDCFYIFGEFKKKPVDLLEKMILSRGKLKRKIPELNLGKLL